MSVQLLRSKLLSVPHGFPTREGGVSPRPFESLNLGASTGDDRANVEKNVRRLAEAGGFDVTALRTISQVHGDRIAEPPQTEKGSAIPHAFAEADGIVSAREGETLGIRVADCIPLLIEDPVGRRIAAVHSGWKGTELEIGARAVEALIARGSRPEDLRAAIGPHIRACCYEVSDELAEKFQRKFGEGAVSRAGPKPHLDLAYAVTRSLRASGVAESHVEVLPHCTHCDARFYSHRRDRGATGRHMAFLTCRFP
ncbi:MAG: peptidoglycan editing factor PgeF [Myxococcaceae bacterium]